MSSQDQSFFNMFMLVIGTLVGVMVLLIFLARIIGDQQKDWVREDPAYAVAVAERIEPVGRVALPGEESAAATPAAVTAEPVPARMTGEQVYNAACVACHGPGVAGAPKTGDGAAWQARLAQGADVLHRHAIEGFQGATGYMPPKGGNATLSDEEVIAAVDFMVGQAG